MMLRVSYLQKLAWCQHRGSHCISRNYCCNDAMAAGWQDDADARRFLGFQP